MEQHPEEKVKSIVGLECSWTRL